MITKKEGVCMMNGVSNYGISMNSQVNFQGKNKLPIKQIEKMTKGLKENITKEQKATQRSINTITELFNEFQNGKIGEKEMINKLTKMLEQIEGKSKGLNVIG